jgi:hypothetical protein
VVCLLARDTARVGSRLLQNEVLERGVVVEDTLEVE